MSKIAIIGDLHFGIRSSSIEHHLYMKDFFEYELFPYLDKHSIKSIILTGDVFDVRKNVNVLVINWFRDFFLTGVVKRGIKVFCVVGNHDIYYRETVEVNTLKTILQDHQMLHPDILTIIESPIDMIIEGEKFFMVPWVCKANHESVQYSLQNSTSDYCVGHFEFNGFEMSKGQVMHTAYTHKAYSKFKHVISGHYHSKSSRDNVTYVGIPYQLTWMDHGDDKGFWVLEDGELSFIKNPRTIYTKIYYSDGFAPDKIDIENHYVQLILTERPPKKELESYLSVLSAMGPYDVKVKESYQEKMSDNIVTHKIVGTEDALKTYVMDSTITLDKDRMTNIMFGLHQKALSQ